jgi:hypothetical protein
MLRAELQRSWQQIAVCSLHWHYCHIAMRFLLDAGQAFIGHIVIWILLVILPFGFYWSYCHLVLRARIMQREKSWKQKDWSYWQYCHDNFSRWHLRHWFYMPYKYTFLYIYQIK